jgi:hypothetical protein
MKVQDQKVANLAKPTWHHFGGKINWFRFFLKELNGELMIWRTKMQARVQGMVQFKDSVCFKLVQIASSEFQPWTPAKVGLRATLDKGSGTKSPRTNLKQIEP